MSRGWKWVLALIIVLIVAIGRLQFFWSGAWFVVAVWASGLSLASDNSLPKLTQALRCAAWSLFQGLALYLSYLK